MPKQVSALQGGVCFSGLQIAICHKVCTSIQTNRMLDTLRESHNQDIIQLDLKFKRDINRFSEVLPKIQWGSLSKSKTGTHPCRT